MTAVQQYWLLNRKREQYLTSTPYPVLTGPDTAQLVAMTPLYAGIMDGIDAVDLVSVAAVFGDLHNVVAQYDNPFAPDDQINATAVLPLAGAITTVIVTLENAFDPTDTVVEASPVPLAGTVTTTVISFTQPFDVSDSVVAQGASPISASVS